MIDPVASLYKWVARFPKQVIQFGWLCLMLVNAGMILGQAPKLITKLHPNYNVYCIMDSLTQKVILPLKYDDVGAFREGLAYVRKDNRYGYIDKTGKEVIPLQYFSAEGF
ncbi:MAG: hypothetical protein RLZZ519_2141, partial [Bacteroidota bacterium]